MATKTPKNVDAKRTGVAIRCARELAGMNRTSDLAARISEIAQVDYSGNRVTKLERGYRMPDSWELDAIAQATGWTVEELLRPPFPVIVPADGDDDDDGGGPRRLSSDGLGGYPQPVAA